MEKHVCQHNGHVHVTALVRFGAWRRLPPCDFNNAAKWLRLRQPRSCAEHTRWFYDPVDD
jgi:hypothetical protein